MGLGPLMKSCMHGLRKSDVTKRQQRPLKVGWASAGHGRESVTLSTRNCRDGNPKSEADSIVRGLDGTGL